MNMNAPRSILSQFQSLYERMPDRIILTFVDDEGRDREKVTVREIAVSGGAIASSLRGWGLAPGDRAILSYLPSVDFLKAFVGCMMAGVVPVAVYPPNLLKLDVDLPRFSALVANSGARVVLTHGEYERARTLRAISDFFGRKKSQWPDIPWYRTDQAAPNGVVVGAWHVPAGSGDAAFFQYTSGSTGSPKGVVVTHGNLVDELNAAARICSLYPNSHAVIWLPQYHDMGLVILLSAIVGNIDMHFMSPLSFLKRPAIWFDVMSRVQATHTAAPNFALELAVRKTTAESRSRWNLSHLHTLICAAEPIRHATVRSFLDAFSVSQLAPNAFCGGYGLAEHTLIVSLCRGEKYVRLDKKALGENRVVLLNKHAPDDIAVSCFSCGPSLKEGARVRIVDPVTCRPCAVWHIGEIWVASSTKARGYHEMEEESQKTFHAHVEGDADSMAYLRTGDLGFLYEGEIYITGRSKDLIIIDGRNIYPQDIEDSVRGCHPWVRPGGLAVFAIDDEAAGGTNARVVLFVESLDDQLDPTQIDTLISAVRRRVFEVCQISCHAIVLGKAGTVKKTTSGKVRRSACKKVFLSGEVHRAVTTMKVDMQKQRAVTLPPMSIVS